MQALRYETRVSPKGRIVLPRLRLKRSTPVEVIILVRDREEDLREIASAASSSLGFWDNATDDRIWNDA